MWFGRVEHKYDHDFLTNIVQYCRQLEGRDAHGRL